MLPTIDRRQQVQALEDHIKAQPQVDLQNFHHFDFGVYSRGGVIPANTVCTGAVHLKPGTFVLAKGTMWIDTGEGVVEVTAPYSCTTTPGTKRVMYAITDCVCYAIIETECTSPEQAEQELVVKSYDSLTPDQLKQLEVPCHSSSLALD